MRAFLITALLLWVAPSLSASESQTIESVKAAVEEFGMAFANADTEVLETLLAQDSIHVNGSSGTLVTRADWLNWIRSRRAKLESGRLSIECYEIEDLIVRVHGDTAAVTGVVTSSGLEEGKPFSSQLRFTNLWVLKDDRWRRAAFHDSPITAAESGEKKEDASCASTAETDANP